MEVIQEWVLMQRRIRSEHLAEVFLYPYDKTTQVVCSRGLSHQEDCACLFTKRLQQRKPAKGKTQERHHTKTHHSFVVFSLRYRQNRNTDPFEVDDKEEIS
jgi:hypothetical protein